MYNQSADSTAVNEYPSRYGDCSYVPPASPPNQLPVQSPRALIPRLRFPIGSSSFTRTVGLTSVTLLDSLPPVQEFKISQLNLNLNSHPNSVTSNRKAQTVRSTWNGDSGNEDIESVRGERRKGRAGKAGKKEEEALDGSVVTPTLTILRP